MSERRACKALDQHRSTQRYIAKDRDDEKALVKRMHELVRRHPRFGYRRIGALLRREGHRVNRKRVWRLWKREGFRVPRRTVKKRSTGSSANGVTRLRATRKNQVWSWDFIFDRTEDGRSLKWFVVVDEFTRECFVLEVERRMTSRDCIDLLSVAMREHGVPEMIRSDNGPEFVATAMRIWLEGANVKTLYIEPGSPWENGVAESFNARLRDELLSAELFGSLGEAKHHAARWRREYNDERPHGALGYLTPSEFAAEHATTKPMEGTESKRTHPATLRVTVEELPSGRHLTRPPMSEATGVGVDKGDTITRLS